jgi:hypothetical protein
VTRQERITFAAVLDWFLFKQSACLNHREGKVAHDADPVINDRHSLDSLERRETSSAAF